MVSLASAVLPAILDKFDPILAVCRQILTYSPFCSQKEYLNAVEQLNLTNEEKELVFWKNAKEIFALEV